MSQEHVIPSALSVELPVIDESELRVPSIDKIESLLKLGDAYFIDEIQDLIDDGYDLKQTKRMLWDEIYDENNHNNINNPTARNIWTQFEYHIKCIYDGIKEGVKYPHLHFSQPEKHKHTPIVYTPLFTPQMGYGTPSSSLSRARSSTTETNPRPIFSTTDSFFSKPINLESKRWNFHFCTEIDTDSDEKKTNQNTDTARRITADPNNFPLPTAPFMQSQTSEAYMSAASASPPPAAVNIHFDIDHNIESEITDDIRNKLRELLKSKKKDQLQSEASNIACCLIPPYKPSLSTGIYGAYTIGYNDGNIINLLKLHCAPFNRIQFVLSAYQKLKAMNGLNMIQIYDEYEHQQLFDDFSHIKSIHIDADNDKIRKEICDYFETEFKCDSETCDSFQCVRMEQVEDVAFQQYYDLIHSYFLHSNICDEEEKTNNRFRKWKRRMEHRRYTSILDQKSLKTNLNIISPAQSPSDVGMSPKNEKVYSKKYVDMSSNQQTTAKYTTSYVGQKEDNLWWKDVVSVTKETQKQQSSEDIYRILVENMGVFRWQNPHGFAHGDNQETMHYQPRFANIKEEALQNEYEPLSKDNWNQALRKSSIFHNSWFRHKIQTKTASFFEDQVSGQRGAWITGESISKSEIITMKLYTDHDKLQFALKKCFRFETFDDIFKTVQVDDGESKEQKNNDYRRNKVELRRRLETFYHWRGALLIALNKFGKKLNGKNNMILYHGINAKMIIKASQTFAFSGPLSTTSSYHVARTFATAKGMILQISSQFPRLNYCNAFDVSLISDYPEEQEWLVGFMYVRLLKIYTRKLTDNVQDFEDLMLRIPTSSWLRQQFFAIHLLNEQIFSMSEELERILAQFLKVNRFECCGANKREVYSEQHTFYHDWDLKYICNQLCKFAHPLMNSNKCVIGAKCNAMSREKRIAAVLWRKFDEFRKYPNLKQRVKFDKISNHLKRFFMQRVEEKDIFTNTKLWTISFEEIASVYPNIREIHFMNEYKFDDGVLHNLIKHIGKNKRNGIQKVVFLYFNYDKVVEGNGFNMPANHRIFKDPNTLNKTLMDKLEALQWRVKHKKNGQTGYKIRIYDTNLN